MSIKLYVIKALNLIAWPALMALMMFSGVVNAQTEYPNRPVKIIIPFPVGGLSDSLARIYGKELSERLGQPFFVESKPGAATNIGAAYVLLAVAHRIICWLKCSGSLPGFKS